MPPQRLTMGTSSTLTSEDVQIFLQDYPTSNRLLGKQLFSPDRVQKAIKFAIGTWNETPPVTNVYTDENFPYKTCLLYGVLEFLFLGESTLEERNYLPYQSGGLAVEEDNSAQAYLNFSNLFGQKFAATLKMLKHSENLDRGWGTISSDFYNHSGGY